MKGRLPSTVCRPVPLASHAVPTGTHLVVSHSRFPTTKTSMEKSVGVGNMTTPELVVSRHIERTSSSSSDSWESSSAPLPSRPQHDIEFGEFELPPPLPPLPKPRGQPESVKEQLPSPIPSRSMSMWQCLTSLRMRWNTVALCLFPLSLKMPEWVRMDRDRALNVEIRTTEEASKP